MTNLYVVLFMDIDRTHKMIGNSIFEVLGIFTNRKEAQYFMKEQADKEYEDIKLDYGNLTCDRHRNHHEYYDDEFLWIQFKVQKKKCGKNVEYNFNNHE